MRMEAMERHIDMQNERFELNQDEIGELNLKIRSQNETLEELVKENLKMEMELNMRNFKMGITQPLK